MNDIFKNIDWLIGLPFLLSVLYYFMVKAMPNTKALTNNGQVNAMGVGLVLGIWLSSEIKGFEFPYFLYGLLLLSALNFVDDLIKIHFGWRLMAQFIACSFLLMQHGLFYSYWSPFLLVMIVGFLNAFNFMDGINGYVGVYSLTILVPLLIQIDFPIESRVVGLATVFFLLGFLFFNFRTKALAWLGDTGSVALAFIILHVFFEHFKDYKLYMFLVLAAFFLIDAGITIFLRQYRGENVFERHEQHLYQQLTKRGKLKSYWVILVVALVQLAVNFIVLSINNIYRQFYASSILILALFIAYLVIRKRWAKI